MKNTKITDKTNKQTTYKAYVEIKAQLEDAQAREAENARKVKVDVDVQTEVKAYKEQQQASDQLISNLKDAAENSAKVQEALKLKLDHVRKVNEEMRIELDQRDDTNEANEKLVNNFPSELKLIHGLSGFSKGIDGTVIKTQILACNVGSSQQPAVMLVSVIDDKQQSTTILKGVFIVESIVKKRSVFILKTSSY